MCLHEHIVLDFSSANVPSTSPLWVLGPFTRTWAVHFSMFCSYRHVPAASPHCCCSLRARGLSEPHYQVTLTKSCFTRDFGIVPPPCTRVVALHTTTRLTAFHRHPVITLFTAHSAVGSRTAVYAVNQILCTEHTLRMSLPWWIPRPQGLLCGSMHCLND